MFSKGYHAVQNISGIKHLLLNCDMGEGCGNDAQLMPYIDIANIACGQHAGDEHTMRETIELAMAAGVAISAHPGFPDRAGFGRDDYPLEGAALTECVLQQIQDLKVLCEQQAVDIRYVKPHGALYNRMMVDEATLLAVLQAVAMSGASAALIVQAGDVAANSVLSALAQTHDIKLLFEAFADRGYRNDGKLAARSSDGAVYTDAARIVAQAQSIADRAQLQSLEGKVLDVAAGTLCFHGDNPAALAALQILRASDR